MEGRYESSAVSPCRASYSRHDGTAFALGLPHGPAFGLSNGLRPVFDDDPPITWQRVGVDNARSGLRAVYPSRTGLHLVLQFSSIADRHLSTLFTCTGSLSSNWQFGWMNASPLLI